MINIVIEQGSPRISYVCEVFFKYILKVDHQLFERKIFDLKKEKNDLECHVNYTNDPSLGGIRVFNHGLLQQNEIVQIEPDIVSGPLPRIFCSANNSEMYDVDFDMFAAGFFLLTEYDKYLKESLDQHGRYLDASYFVVENKIYESPLINKYAEQLWQLLHTRFGDLERKQEQFKFEITFDIDFAWAYLNKGLITYIGAARDLLKLDFNSLRIRLKSIFSQKDPYDTFDEIFDLCPVERTRFFFLINGSTRNDGRFSERNKHYRKLIKRTKEKGYPVGTHPSYLTYKNKMIFKSEKEAIEDIIGAKVTYSRQHYLRYSIPITYRNLIGQKIGFEYTSTLPAHPGFKYGMASPFPWFDLEKNVMTSLVIHPTMVMDASMNKYKKLDPDTAILEIKKIIDKTKEVNGKFVLLWHNSSLSELNEWKGWKPVFKEVVTYLKASV